MEKGFYLDNEEWNKMKKENPKLIGGVAKIFDEFDKKLDDFQEKNINSLDKEKLFAGSIVIGFIAFVKKNYPKQEKQFLKVLWQSLGDLKYER